MIDWNVERRVKYVESRQSKLNKKYARIEANLMHTLFVISVTLSVVLIKSIFPTIESFVFLILPPFMTLIMNVIEDLCKYPTTEWEIIRY